MLPQSLCCTNKNNKFFYVLHCFFPHSCRTMHLLSFDVEPDALQSMTPTTAATVQQYVTSPQNHSSSPSLSQSTPDSGIELGSPELGPLNVMSILNVDRALESSPASNQIANSVSQQDGPDTAVTQSPERPNTGESWEIFYLKVYFTP